VGEQVVQLAGDGKAFLGDLLTGLGVGGGEG
jgi:hypothetical protein